MGAPSATQPPSPGLHEALPQAAVERLETMSARVAELEEMMADPEIAGRNDRFAPLVKEHGSLCKPVSRYRELKDVEKQKAETQTVLDEAENDPELQELAQEELAELGQRAEGLLEEIRAVLFADDEDANRNAIMEIRAGTGGEEAALFAADLMRMYLHYADSNGWRVQLLDSSATALGGFKGVVFAVEGRDAFGKLRFESGGHRVQRVPVTDSSGRIHTSLVTVAVLPEAEDVDVEIKQADVQMDFYHASGPGGQKVNKTSSAVRLTHIPTGIVCQCQDCPSQHKNRASAMRVLRSRLYEYYASQQESERREQRRTQIGSGDRSQKVRTYNFPDNRVTDHRVGLTIHNLEGVLRGELDDLVNALSEYDRAQRTGWGDGRPDS